MRVTSLASGSSGNALVVEHDGAAILVDCGAPIRRLAALLREAGVAPTDLTAVLITHEHGDHIAGIGAIPRAHDLPFFMTPGTRATDPRVSGAPVFAGRHVVEQPVGSTCQIGPFTVTSCPVSHDGAEVCGYLIEGGGYGVAVFTDLGLAEPHLEEPLSHADLIVIEANHDEELLRQGPYPWPLKQRVAGDRGHLSNAACAALLCQVLPDAGREIWLAHLSRTNNRPQIAASEVRQTLHAHGHAPDAHTIRVLPQWGAALCWAPGPRQLALGL